MYRYPAEVVVKLRFSKVAGQLILGKSVSSLIIEGNHLVTDGSEVKVKDQG